LTSKNPFLAAALLSLAVIGVAFWLISPAIVQSNSGIGVPGVPDDWSNHHLVFSHPGSFSDAVRSGSLQNWYRLVTEPRFTMQQLRRTRVVGRPDPVRLPKLEVGNDWTMSLGSGGKVGAGQFPAKYTFLINSAPSCAGDYVVYNTGLAGSSTQASVVAFNNLYGTTCSTPVPNIYWAYNTGGTAATSPIISPNGNEVAFVETVGTTANLVVLRFANSGGTVSSPASINSVANGSYSHCIAPCYTTIPFSGGANDTNSPPFYIYDGSDVMYAGDNNGLLHKFTGVFAGTPAESTSNGWPVTVSSGNILTGAVYEPGSTLLFVGSSSANLYSVTTTGASSQTVVASGTLGVGTGVVAPPLVDSTPAAAKVYAIVGDDNTGSETCGGGATGPCNGLYQFATNFAGGTTGIKEILGQGAAATTVYAGSFDNVHYTGNGTTGNLYVCGTESPGNHPRLWQIPMNATFNAAVHIYNTPASGAASCSPVTEILGTKLLTTLTTAITTTTQTAITVASTGTATDDYIQVDSEIMQITAGGGTTNLTVTRGQLGTTAATHANGATVDDIQDWIFLGVSANGIAATGCTAGSACLYNFLITAAGTSGTATAGLAVSGGSSGTIVDNTSTTTGASQIYFSSLTNGTCVGNGTTGNGTGGCATQAPQSGP